MPRLTARYEAELPLPVLLQADGMSLGKFSEPVFGDGRLRFAASIDGFDVVLTVRPDGGGWSGLPDGTALIGAYDCVVDVSRDESEAVPEVVQTPRGRDFTARVPYFQARAGKYGGAARSCLERFLSFVRFSLGQPLIWGSGDSPPRVEVLFFAWPKKSTPKKGHPDPLPLLRSGALRFSPQPGVPDGTPVPAGTLRTSLFATLRAVPSAAAMLGSG